MSQPLSILDYAIEQIRTKIITGEYKEGKKLTTKEVADDLQISQTPVKEAFNRLVSEKLLEPIPRRGYYVTSFSTAYFLDVLDARTLLEAFIAKNAVLHTEEYADILQNMRDLLKEEADNQMNYSKSWVWEKNYHCSFAKIAGNEFIYETYSNLWDISSAYYLRNIPNYPYSEPSKNPLEHQEMYDLLIGKDAVNLQKLFRKHVERMQDRFKQHRRK
ncbi:MAG: GntR family transcriptional regulator [Eubacteriales bacterium]|nr:GntR family transcriptional regulator [Eubacteriales bacterium]